MSDVLREFIPHAKGLEKRSLSIVFGFECWESVPLVCFCRVLSLQNFGKNEVFFSGLESLVKVAFLAVVLKSLRILC